MTQKFSLYEDLSIRENLDFIARMYRLRPAQAAGRRGARRPRPRRPGQSSSPARCRAAGSSGWRWPPACCTSPQLLLLDEPTAGVDPKARRDFWDEIRRLSAQGVTVLVSTHYMDEAVQCDFIAYIAYGKKLIDGPSARDPGAWSGSITWRVEGPDLAALEAGCSASRASSRWRASARCCTSRAPTGRRSTATVAAVRGRGHASLEPAGGRARGGLHLPDGRGARQFRRRRRRGAA